MCGRFTLRTPANEWIAALLPGFDASSVPPSPPRYNVAPTQSIWAVARRAGDAGAAPGRFRWGLVPHWADDLAIGNRMINARSETADTKPSFRNAWKRQRCLIPADGYFEWKSTDDGKQPFLIESADPSRYPILAMAGLWERNDKLRDPKSDSDGPLWTCTILTTAANSITGQVHDRMPVLVDAPEIERWLDPNFSDTDHLKSLLRPAADDRLRVSAVSRHVNSVRHDDAGCVETISLDRPSPGRLF